MKQRLYGDAGKVGEWACSHLAGITRESIAPINRGIAPDGRTTQIFLTKSSTVISCKIKGPNHFSLLWNGYESQ